MVWPLFLANKAIVSRSPGMQYTLIGGQLFLFTFPMAFSMLAAAAACTRRVNLR
jgi:hypothetical protein